METTFVQYTFWNFLFFNVAIPAVFAAAAYLIGKSKGKG